MGNRLLLETLKEFENKDSDISFGNIILVAPDLDQAKFEENSNLYPKFSENTTLYVSPHDKAIKLSRLLRKYNRVGLSPPVIVAKDIDTINVNQKNTKYLLTFSHSYYKESRDILQDLNAILRHSTPPDERLTLKKKKATDSHKYWDLMVST